MPASSRKRNKGKERKAKQAAGKEKAERVKMQHTWHSWALGNMGLCGGGTTFNIPCSHGFAVVPDKSHPVSSFMCSYLLCTHLTDTISKHPEVWNDSSHRKLAAEMLTKIGANLLCVPDTINHHRDSQQFIINIAYAITMLENYDETLDYVSNSVKPNVSKTYLDLYCSSTNAFRDLLKFYRKRMSCKCLKKMHLEARKTLPKLGACCYCNKIKDRSLLMVCSRCMFNRYCSRECQVAASPEHREDCDKFVLVRQHSLAYDAP